MSSLRTGIFDNNKIIRCILSGGYYATILCGITYFEYDHQLQRVAKCQRYHIYCCCILIVAMVMAPIAMCHLYNGMEFLHQSPLLALVGFKRYTVLEALALFTLVSQIFWQHEIINGINRCIHIRRALRSMFFYMTNKTEKESHIINPEAVVANQQFNSGATLSVCLKLIVLLLGPTWTLFLIIFEDAIERIWYFFALVFFYYCQLILQLSLCMCFVGTLLLTHYVRQLNQLLRMVLDEVLLLKANGRSFYGTTRRKRNKQFHWLTYEMQQLMGLHAKLLKLSRKLNKLYNCQLLFFFGFVLIECVVHLFILYFISYNERFGHGQLWLNPMDVAFVSSLICDMCLVVYGMQQMKSELQATRNILSEQTLCMRRCDMDACLNDAILNFTAYCRMQDISYTVCGLFIIDNRLIFNIFQTIITHLLILIQFDKIM